MGTFADYSGSRLLRRRISGISRVHRGRGREGSLTGEGRRGVTRLSSSGLFFYFRIILILYSRFCN